MSSKVLLLDDDAGSAAQLEVALRDLGFATSLVPENDVFGAGRALARLAVERIAIILISVAPPHLAGLATFERMRRDARASKLPMVLISTAFGMLHDHARSPLPADGYIQRPHDPAILLPEIHRCLQLLAERSTSRVPLRDAPVTPTPSVSPEAGPAPDPVADTEPPGPSEEAEADVVEASDEAPPSGMLPERQSRLTSDVPQSRGNPDELRERLREGRLVLAQLQERLHSEREEHAMAVARAEFAMSSASAANGTIAKQALFSEQKAQLAEGDVLRLQVQVDRLENQLDAAVEQLAATARHHRESDERRAREDEASLMTAEAAQRGAVLAAVDESVRRLREEHAEALATEAREHAVALERAAASLEKERRERAEEGSWSDEDSPALAALRAELETVRAALKEAELAHAAALASSEDARVRERAAASQRQDELEKATSEAVMVGIRQARRAVQEEHDETLQAMTRAHDSDLARERARADALKVAMEADLQGLRADMRARLEATAEGSRLLTEQLASAEEVRTALTGERDRFARELAAARAEREAAMWAAAVEAEQKVADEHAGDRAALETAEAALVAMGSAHAAELIQLDRSVDKMLEQERRAAERSMAETRAAAVQAVAIGVREAQRAARMEFEAQLEDRDRARAEDLAAVRGEAESIRRDLAEEREREHLRSKALSEELESERAARLDASAATAQQRGELARVAAALAIAETTVTERQRELEDERDRGVARARALETKLSEEREEREAAQRRFVELEAQRLSDAVAGAALADDLRVRLRAADDAFAEEEERSTAALAAAMAEFAAQQSILVQDREDAARAAERERARVDAEGERNVHADERRRLVTDREDERAARVAASSIVAQQNDDLSRLGAALANAETKSTARQKELEDERDREVARARALETTLSEDRGAREVAQRRLVELEAQRGSDAVASAAVADDLRARLRAADDAFKAEEARSTAALAAAMAEFAARQSVLVQDREDVVRAAEQERARADAEAERKVRAEESQRLVTDREDERAARVAASNIVAQQKEELSRLGAALTAAEATSTARQKELEDERDLEVARARALGTTLSEERGAREAAQRRLVEVEARSTAALAAAMAEFAAHQSILVQDRADAQAARVAASNVVAQQKEELSRLDAALTAAEATSTARQKEVEDERDLEVARARALETTLREDRAARDEAERRLVELQSKRGVDAIAADAVAEELRGRLQAADDAWRAAEAERRTRVEEHQSTVAELQGERAALLAASSVVAQQKDELSRVAAALSVAETTSSARQKELAEERDREVDRARAFEVASSDERDRERAARSADRQRALAEMEAERNALVEAHERARQTAALTFEALRKELADERDIAVNRARSFEERSSGDRVAREETERRIVEVQATRVTAEATADDLRARLQAADELSRAEQARATSALASAMADFASQQSILMDERERAVARVSLAEAELGRERDAHARALNEQEQRTREQEAQSREREAALSAAADETALEAGAANATQDALHAAEVALAEEKIRTEALSVALRTAREGEQDLAEEQRKLRREFEGERKVHEAALARAAREAQTASRETARTLAADKARIEELTKEIEGERASRDEQIARVANESASYRERYEGALAGATHEAREALKRAEERIRVQSEQAASSSVELRADLATRDRHIDAMRAEGERRVAALQGEHARAIERLLVADTDARARQTAAHELALDELRCELNERHRAEAVAAARDTGRESAEQQALVAKLRAELTAINEAHAAERLSRGPLSARPRTQPERVRPSAEYRQIAADVSRTELVPSVRRPSGEIAVTRDPRDPREVLRSVLLRSLAAGQAELAITMALGAAGCKELPAERDELLALVERHLFAELIGHLGKKEANGLMDELASALSSGVPPRPVPNAPDARPSPTKPPEMKSHVPTLRPSLPPDSDMHRPPLSGRRAVLVIDGDRAARARVARELSQGGCDVSVRDSCADIAAGAHAFDVIVTDILGVSLEELLSSFGHRPLPCAVIAWTDDVETARALFGAAGLRGVLVVRKETRLEHLVATVRSTFEEVQGVARG